MIASSWLWLSLSTIQDARDNGINVASSYLDLAPLYGNCLDEQNSMRQFRDGLLKPECFAHKRVLTFPPTCRVLLLMFNRFHNYAVTQLSRYAAANWATLFFYQADTQLESTRLTASKSLLKPQAFKIRHLGRFGRSLTKSFSRRAV